MVRSYCKFLNLAAVAAFCGVALSTPAHAALPLLSPSEGQAVRENVKIQVPANIVPDSGFVSVLVGKGNERKFVVSMAPAKTSKGALTFYWNSKGPYYDPSDPKTPKYFKDGPYPLTVQVHGADGNMLDSATVNITLKNKIAQPNPAPAVKLINSLPFGHANTYGVHADVEIFNAVNLPVLGGYATTSDFKLIQSVEDVRSGGELLLRCRLDDNPTINYRGIKTVLYDGMQIKPQLYRLVTQYGKVVNKNMFSKQAKFTLMDILPVLPTHAVRNGDSWPDSFTLKVEGLTNPIKLAGDSKLDSFEWQDGKECAKIMSDLKGDGQISLAGGKVISAGSITAKVTTYFAYKTGRMLRREIKLEYPAAILPGAGDDLINNSADPASAGSPMAAPMPFDDEESGGAAPTPTPYPPSPMAPGGRTSGRSTGRSEPAFSKGSVRINVVVRLEK